MDNFNVPRLSDDENAFPLTDSNYIMPGKRPQSSMTPTIIVDSESGEVRMVVGASGGFLISTAIAQVCAQCM